MIGQRLWAMTTFNQWAVKKDPIFSGLGGNLQGVFYQLRSLGIFVIILRHFVSKTTR